MFLFSIVDTSWNNYLAPLDYCNGDRVEYTYDDNVNILSRKEYAYTTGTLGSAAKTINYSYGDSDWGDLLTAYDGESITYDEIGNPLSDGTWTYTWEHGRELKEMESDGCAVSYQYNADGLRTEKTVRTIVHYHDYSQTETVDATCTEAGYIVYCCDCGESYTEQISALGHSYKTSGTNAVCTRCGYQTGMTPLPTPVQPTLPPISQSIDPEAESLSVSIESELYTTQTETYSYVYNGSSLSQMTLVTQVDGGDPTSYTLYFAYDASGAPMSVTYNGTNYYYATNIQGDVTAVEMLIFAYAFSFAGLFISSWRVLKIIFSAFNGDDSICA